MYYGTISFLIDVVGSPAARIALAGGTPDALAVAVRILKRKEM